MVPVRVTIFTHQHQVFAHDGVVVVQDASQEVVVQVASQVQIASAVVDQVTSQLEVVVVQDTSQELAVVIDQDTSQVWLIVSQLHRSSHCPS